MFHIIEKRLQHRCFPVNIAKFLRTPIFKNICKRLLLSMFFEAFLARKKIGSSFPFLQGYLVDRLWKGIKSKILFNSVNIFLSDCCPPWEPESLISIKYINLFQKLTRGYLKGTKAYKPHHSFNVIFSLILWKKGLVQSFAVLWSYFKL